MTARTCNTCRWRGAGGDPTACYRYPPAMTVWPSPHGSHGIDGPFPTRPHVQIDDTCGEWTPPEQDK